MKVFHILIFLISINLYSQEVLFVEYDVQFSAMNTTAFLYSSKNESFYIEGKKDNETMTEFETNSFNVGKFVHSEVYQNLKSPDLLYLNIFKDDDRFSTIKKDYFIKDSIPPLDWELLDSPEIEFLGFKCKSAKVKFRGSTFLAYYSTEIPTSFGPWKFGNLSGLILKVSSLENPAISWEAKKIVYPYKIEDENLLKNDKSKYTMSMQSFVEEHDKLLEELSRNIYAKMGTAYNPIPKVIQREKLRERKYEWETW